MLNKRTDVPLPSLVEPLLGLSAARRQRRGLAMTGHRPWPAPEGPWLMGQSWENLLFAHWRMPTEAIRPLVPRELSIDEWDGTAWIGVTPFEVRALRPHGAPPLPAGSRFPELNVRTYVTTGAKPGISFLSLDAASRLAVFAARSAYRLPYFHACMSIKTADSRVSYESERLARVGERVAKANLAAGLAVDYGPAGDVFHAGPGTLAHFLTERYCLYRLDRRGRLRRVEIHHPPWPLQPATATFRKNTMTAPLGIELDDGGPLLHFARRQDVVVWPP